MTTAAPVRESDHPYLSGNYAPVSEEISAVDLDVTGSIPDYLDGRYLRIGPNPMGNPDPARYHWFLGAGMAHGLRLRDGKAHWYRNRWVRSTDVARKLDEPWPGGPTYGGFDFAANTNIIGHAGKTFAIAESGARPYELTDELDTVGPSDFDGTLFCGYTAHPKCDPASGELHAVSYNPMRGNIVRYTVTGVDGKVRHTVDIRLREQTMMHDFSLTEKFVILYDLPVALDFGKRRGVSGTVRRAARGAGFRTPRGHARLRARLVAWIRHAVSVGTRKAGADRRDAARRHSCRHPLVRSATLLRIPSPQRL